MIVRAHPRRAATVAGLAVGALALAGCGSSGSGSDPAKPQVMASTSAWGSVAQAVGGNDVQVDSIVSDPSADPHSHESSPREAAQVSKADLVLTNGGGYDEFVDKVLASSGEPKPTVRAFDSEHEPPEPGESSANEHVWYDLHAVQEVADHTADELSKIAPQKAAAFHDSAARFRAGVGDLQQQVEQIKQQSQGKKVIATEPVAHYVLDQAGLDDVTPESFVHAVEDENDPSPEAVAQLQDALNAHQVSAVVFNPQTESAVTKQVRDTAQRNQVPVVEMTETLPPGKDYLQWMGEQITNLGTALHQGAPR